MRTSRASVIVVLSVLAALAAACSGDDSPTPSTRASTSRSATSGSADDANLIERYVAAMANGDIDGAMRLRCDAARIPSASRGLARDQLGRLLDTAGLITVAQVRRNDPPNGLAPIAEGDNPIELSYYLAVDGEPVDEPLLTVAVEEDGRRRLCGFSTDAAAELHKNADGALGDLGPTSAALSDLMPEPPSPDYRQVSDQAVEPKPEEGEVERWGRTWQVGDYGGANALAIRFNSPKAADDGARQFLKAVASDGVGSFAPSDVRGASGVRYLGFAWLWIQPPNHGPYIDRVVHLQGDVVIVVQASNLPMGAGHELVSALARESARLAGR